MKLVSASGTKIVDATHFNQVRKIHKLGSSIPAGRNPDPTGMLRQGMSVAPKRCVGDTIKVFGEEYIGFFGGEGGRGWTVRSTTC